VLAVVLVLGGWAIYEGGGWQQANFLEQRLLNVDTEIVPEVVRELGPYRRWINPMLYYDLENTDSDKIMLHASLALLPADAGQADYLRGRLLTARGPGEVKAIRALLHEHAPDSLVRFWPELQDDRGEKTRRLRAACALARFAPDDPRWAEVGDEVVRCLAGENILLLREWAELLEPVRAQLVPHGARRLAAADAGSFAAYLAMLRAYPEDAAAALSAQLDRSLPATAQQEDKEALAR
jgi:hypothetical protein